MGSITLEKKFNPTFHGFFQCFQLISNVLLNLGMFFMPFSPKWLIHHDQKIETRRVFSNFRNLDQNHEIIEIEFLKIKTQSVFEKRSNAQKWPHLINFTPWNIFKLQFVARVHFSGSKPCSIESLAQ